MNKRKIKLSLLREFVKNIPVRVLLPKGVENKQNLTELE